MFGLKDVFTIGNLVSGFTVVVLAMHGEVGWAAAAVLIGYGFDICDGLVARLMRSGNRFGAELDNIADLVTYSVAPSFVIFAAYRSFSEPLAAVLSVFPIACGSLRFARFNVRRIEFPGYWVGLPRPASAVFIVSFCASRAFAVPAVFYAGMAILPAVALLNLSLVPFHGHHRRGSTPLVVGFVATWIISTAVAAAMGYVWEACLVWSGAYASLQHLFIPRADRQRLREFVRAWRSTD